MRNSGEGKVRASLLSTMLNHVPRHPAFAAAKREKLGKPMHRSAGAVRA